MKSKQQKRQEAEARAAAYYVKPFAQKIASSGKKEKAKLERKAERDEEAA